MKSEMGFSLIELLIVVAILGVAVSLALPSYTATLANNKVKATAESILAGLHQARSSAIQRNAPVRFQLVSSLDSTCILSATSAQWVVTETDQVARGDPVGKCDMDPWSPPDPCVDSGTHSCTSDPFILTKSSISASGNVTVNADQPIVVFSPIGRVLEDLVTGYAANAMTVVQVRSSVAAAKQWDVRVSPNGSIKICDAQAAAGGANAC
jgi:prepilin-type N-terminal cleavage/methylation domain-containing protein